MTNQFVDIDLGFNAGTDPSGVKSGRVTGQLNVNLGQVGTASTDGTGIRVMPDAISVEYSIDGGAYVELVNVAAQDIHGPVVLGVDVGVGHKVLSRFTAIAPAGSGVSNFTGSVYQATYNNVSTAPYTADTADMPAGTAIASAYDPATQTVTLSITIPAASGGESMPNRITYVGAHTAPSGIFYNGNFNIPVTGPGTYTVVDPTVVSVGDTRFYIINFGTAVSGQFLSRNHYYTVRAPGTPIVAPTTINGDFAPTYVNTYANGVFTPNGSGAFDWHVSGLPDGANAYTSDGNSLTVGGNIPASGSYDLVITAKNDSGSTSRAVTWVVGDTPPTPPAEWTSSNLEDALVGVNYLQWVNAHAEGSVTYEFNPDVAHPAWLQLDQFGMLSGTPDADGPATFSINAIYLDTRTPQTFTIHVLTPVEQYCSLELNGSVGDYDTGLVNLSFAVYGHSSPDSNGNPLHLPTSVVAQREDAEGNWSDIYDLTPFLGEVTGGAYVVFPDTAPLNSFVHYRLHVQGDLGELYLTQYEPDNANNGHLPYMYTGDFVVNTAPPELPVALGASATLVRWSVPTIRLTATIGQPATHAHLPTSVVATIQIDGGAPIAVWNVPVTPGVEQSFDLTGNGITQSSVVDISFNAQVPDADPGYQDYNFGYLTINLGAPRLPDDFTIVGTWDPDTDHIVLVFTDGTPDAAENTANPARYDIGNNWWTLSQDNNYNPLTVPDGPSWEITDPTDFQRGAGVVDYYTQFYTADSWTPLGTPAVHVAVPDPAAPVQITNGNLPSGQSGREYSFQFTADGDGPFVWTVAGGTLPNGLSLSTDGALTGIAGTARNYRFAVTVDRGDSTAFHQYTVSILPASGGGDTPTGVPTFTVDEDLGETIENASYNRSLGISGGGLTTEIADGALPDGIELTNTGVLTGTPTTHGDFVFVVRATNTFGSASREFSLTVAAPPPTINTGSPPDGTINRSYFFGYGADGAGPFVWGAANSALPDGLELNPQTGVLSGIPAALGTFTFTIQVVGASGVPTTRDYTLNIVPPADTTILYGNGTLGVTSIASNNGTAVFYGNGTLTARALFISSISVLFQGSGKLSITGVSDFLPPPGVPEVVVDQTQTNRSITGYSVQEDATPIDAASTEGGVGQIQYGIPETSATLDIFDTDMELDDDFRGMTGGHITQIDIENGFASVTADSRLGALVGDAQALPQSGTFEAVARYYLGLGNITDGVVFDDAVADIQVTTQGWYGDAWLNLKQFCTAYGVEVALVSNKIVFRPARSRNINVTHKTGLKESIQQGDLAQNIEIKFYENLWKNNVLVYPRTPDEVSGEQVYQIEAGGVLEDDIDLSVSLESVIQPICVDDVSKDYDGSQSVYSVRGVDNSVITPSAWVAGGGKIELLISDDSRSVHMVITASKDQYYGPYRIAGRVKEVEDLTTIIVPPGTDTTDTDGPAKLDVSYPKGATKKERAKALADAKAEAAKQAAADAKQIDENPADSEEDYASLRIVGTGALINEHTVTLPTGVPESRTTVDVGVTVENPFVSSLADAFRLGVYTASRYRGEQHTMTATVTEINQLMGSGSILFETIADFDKEYAHKTIGQFNAIWAGKTIKDFNAAQLAKVVDNFDNQVFGNVCGARFRHKNAMFRITNATITESDVEITAVRDTMIEEFNAAHAGKKISDFNAQYAGMTLKQFGRVPLLGG